MNQDQTIFTQIISYIPKHRFNACVKKYLGNYKVKSFTCWEKLRRIKYFDSENRKSLVLLTNNFRLSAITIAKLFKQRWQIELFFKWIKQNLKIKSFYGNSANTVKTQVY